MWFCPLWGPSDDNGLSPSLGLRPLALLSWPHQLLCGQTLSSSQELRPCPSGCLLQEPSSWTRIPSLTVAQEQKAQVERTLNQPCFKPCPYPSGHSPTDPPIGFHPWPPQPSGWWPPMVTLSQSMLTTRLHCFKSFPSQSHCLVSGSWHASCEGPGIFSPPTSPIVGPSSEEHINSMLTEFFFPLHTPQSHWQVGFRASTLLLAYMF